jgi:hypothetical protein
MAPKRTYWTAAPLPEKKTENGKLHVEQKENQWPHTERLRAGLKEGGYIYGNRIVNLIFT